jgi:hypothetical protein
MGSRLRGNDGFGVDRLNPCPHPSHGKCRGPLPSPLQGEGIEKARGLQSTGSLCFARRGKAASSVGLCPPAEGAAETWISEC